MTAGARAAAGVGVAGLAGALLCSFAALATPARDGQLVFVPVLASSAAMAGAPGGSVSIVTCRATATGLLVSGHVSGERPVTVIGVAPGDATGAGVAVAAAFAAGAQKLPGAAPGDFLVTLPWAGPAARFAVVDAESLGPGSGGVVMGPVVGCPGKG